MSDPYTITQGLNLEGNPELALPQLIREAWALERGALGDKIDGEGNILADAGLMLFAHLRAMQVKHAGGWPQHTRSTAAPGREYELGTAIEDGVTWKMAKALLDCEQALRDIEADAEQVGVACRTAERYRNSCDFVLWAGNTLDYGVAVMQAHGHLPARLVPGNPAETMQGRTLETGDPQIPKDAADYKGMLAALNACYAWWEFTKDVHPLYGMLVDRLEFYVEGIDGEIPNYIETERGTDDDGMPYTTYRGVLVKVPEGHKPFASIDAKNRASAENQISRYRDKVEKAQVTA